MTFKRLWLVVCFVLLTDTTKSERGKDMGHDISHELVPSSTFGSVSATPPSQGYDHLVNRGMLTDNCCSDFLELEHIIILAGFEHAKNDARLSLLSMQSM